MACRGPFRKRKILRVFSHRTCKLLFDTARPLPYTLLFVREVTNLSGAAPEILEPLSWKGISSVPEQARRNGSEERPEWGASPAKPSKPLRTDTKRIALPLGVRTEFLAGCPPDSQQTFQQQGTLSRSFVRAPGGGAKCPAR